MSTRFCSKHLDKFDPTQYFAHYDYYIEVTDVNIENIVKENYNDGYFDFGKGLRDYEFSTFIIYDINNDNMRKKYIVAEEKINDDEIELLRGYCQCEYHKTSWWNIPYPCPCCYGCIESDFPAQSVIKKTRQYYYDMHHEQL